MSNIIDSWTLNYRPEGGGRYLGILSVSDAEVRFSADDLAEDVVLPGSGIASVEATKRRLMKRAVVTMKDGQSHLFEYGLLSVEPIVDAISSIL